MANSAAFEPLIVNELRLTGAAPTFWMLMAVELVNVEPTSTPPKGNWVGVTERAAVALMALPVIKRACGEPLASSAKVRDA